MFSSLLKDLISDFIFNGRMQPARPKRYMTFINTMYAVTSQSKFVTNRICKVCSSGDVEDERHLIFSGNKYSSLRQSFFTETQKICKNFSTLIQDAQFFWLMNLKMLLYCFQTICMIVSNLEMCSNIVYYNTMS